MSIKRNYILNTSYQVLNLIVPFITTPYIARVLGADGVGLSSYLSAITSYFVLFASLGIRTYGQREISFLQKDRDSRSRVFSEIETLCLFSVFIVLVCFYSFVAIWRKNTILLFIFSIQIVSVGFDVSWLFSGMEDFTSITLRSLFVKLINIIAIFIFVKSKDDLWVYVLLSSGLLLLGNISIWPFIKKHVDFSLHGIHPFRHIYGAVSFFIPSIAIQVYMYMDKVMLGSLTHNTFQNGYYEQAVKLVRLALTIVTSLSTILIPRIGALIAEKKNDEIRLTIHKVIRFVWLLSIPMIFGLLGSIDFIVPWFFGEEYRPVVPIVYYLAPQVLLVGLNNVTAFQCLIPMKRQNIYTVTVIIGAVFNLIANAFLIPQRGAVGAAIASTLAEFVVLIVEIIALRKDFQIALFYKHSIKYVLAGGTMFFLIQLIKRFLSPGIISSILIVGFGFLSYCLILLVLKDSFFIDGLHQLIKRNKDR